MMVESGGDRRNVTDQQRFNEIQIDSIHGIYSDLKKKPHRDSTVYNIVFPP